MDRQLRRKDCLREQRSKLYEFHTLKLSFRLIPSPGNDRQRQERGLTGVTGISTGLVPCNRTGGMLLRSGRGFIYVFEEKC